MRWMRTGLCIVLFGLLCGRSATASDTFATLTDRGVRHDRPQTLDVTLVLGYLFGSYNHLGFGLWYGLPVLAEGFASELNDALYVEAGAVTERYSYSMLHCKESWWRVTPMGGVRYQMYLTPVWTAFATGKVGYGMGFADSYSCPIGYSESSASISQVGIDLSLGAYLRLQENWNLRFELGYFGAQAGAGMQF